MWQESKPASLDFTAAAAIGLQRGGAVGACPSSGTTHQTGGACEETSCITAEPSARRLDHRAGGRFGWYELCSVQRAQEQRRLKAAQEKRCYHQEAQERGGHGEEDQHRWAHRPERAACR